MFTHEIRFHYTLNCYTWEKLGKCVATRLKMNVLIRVLSIQGLTTVRTGSKHVVIIPPFSLFLCNFF